MFFAMGSNLLVDMDEKVVGNTEPLLSLSVIYYVFLKIFSITAMGTQSQCTGTLYTKCLKKRHCVDYTVKVG
jgi:hypothetical protein